MSSFAIGASRWTGNELQDARSHQNVATVTVWYDFSNYETLYYISLSVFCIFQSFRKIQFSLEPTVIYEAGEFIFKFTPILGTLPSFILESLSHSVCVSVRVSVRVRVCVRVRSMIKRLQHS